MGSFWHGICSLREREAGSVPAGAGNSGSISSTINTFWFGGRQGKSSVINAFWFGELMEECIDKSKWKGSPSYSPGECVGLWKVTMSIPTKWKGNFLFRGIEFWGVAGLCFHFPVSTNIVAMFDMTQYRHTASFHEWSAEEVDTTILQ